MQIAQQLPLRPWVVVDWNAIRSLGQEQALRCDCSFVVCDEMLLEAADVDETDRASMVAKLERLVRHRSIVDRILAVRAWPYLDRRECTPTAPTVRGPDLIDWEVTLELRARLREQSNFAEWILRARELPAFREYLATRERFVESYSAFADDPYHTRQESFKRLRSGKTSLTEWVRQPDLVPKIARTMPASGRNYGSRAWQARLRAFPDRTAIGRLYRLVAWYGAQRVLRRDQRADKFSNNYEDSRYAFYASYMYELATRDKGLIDCVRSLFPKVRIRANLVGG